MLVACNCSFKPVLKEVNEADQNCCVATSITIILELFCEFGNALKGCLA